MSARAGPGQSADVTGDPEGGRLHQHQEGAQRHNSASSRLTRAGNSPVSGNAIGGLQLLSGPKAANTPVMKNLPIPFTPGRIAGRIYLGLLLAGLLASTGPGRAQPADNDEQGG